MGIRTTNPTNWDSTSSIEQKIGTLRSNGMTCERWQGLGGDVPEFPAVRLQVDCFRILIFDF